ncbi:hypothetical protein [Algibacter lectus]|uniref:Uncharacterized protein n=1 Tax=Algibacter lectus TaxID=221126 RepID=A0A4R8MMJ8_9FLAO|nr:hypothetical protein [Algibacter lectus]MWW26839.1 hypothetical protein [Algibacter lectus]TDY65316.1 hypothetical protein DFQ06_0136 [Algibacter lectus]
MLTIYINSESYIENQDWKFAEGTHIGDWLGKKNFEIKDGIIYSNGGKAKIVFSLGLKLIIEDIETQQKGFYVNKS